jgi:Domain of unknown function (DUF1083).
MKKILSIVFAVCLIMSAMSVASFAAAGGANFGSIPKTSDAIVLDGIKDAVYDSGLILKVDARGPDSAHGSEPDTTTTGVVYVVYTDGFIQIFGEMTDSTVIPQNADKDLGEPWMTDSLEVFLDYGNKSETPLQYRISSYNYPSYQFPDVNSYGTEMSGTVGVFEWAAKQTATGYTTEFKIPATISAGDQIGFLLQINDMVDESTRACVYVKSTLEPDSWTPDLYDYITVSADSVTGVVIEEIAAPVEAAPVEAAAAPAATAPVTAAQTSDMNVIMAIGTMLTSGAALLISKKRK